jgi:hypothetical protein
MRESAAGFRAQRRRVIGALAAAHPPSAQSSGTEESEQPEAAGRSDPMPDYVCMIQESQEADRRREVLAEGLRTIGKESFGDDPSATEITWVVLKKGFAWTAGEPSTSSIVIRSVPVGLPLDQREAFLRRVCALWEKETGCSINEIVATAWDGPLPL